MGNGGFLFSNHHSNHVNGHLKKVMPPYLSAYNEMIDNVACTLEQNHTANKLKLSIPLPPSAPLLPLPLSAPVPPM